MKLELCFISLTSTMCADLWAESHSCIVPGTAASPRVVGDNSVERILRSVPNVGNEIAPIFPFACFAQRDCAR